jgi:SAM-dependent methyltransferase
MTTDAAVEKALRDGHYAAQQIFCRDRLIAWSHRRRFEIGLRLASRFRGQRLLDYGCGDGTFLALLHAGSWAPAESTGAELDPFQVESCTTRFGARPDLRFISIAALDARRHHGRYDIVTCMEVLEHVVDLDNVIRQLWSLTADNGRLLVSVPVEVGLPLVLKQLARRIAGWRGIGDYPGTGGYSPREYWASLFAGAAQHIERPTYRGNTGPSFHDHKGFNWMSLRERLQTWFSIEETVASPVPWLGPRVATQVWLVARKKKPEATPR